MSVGVVNKQTGERIPTAGMPAIDDALDLTSVNPVQNDIITAALANKQDKTDNNLETTSKTVVGAVNELKSGLTNLNNLVRFIGLTNTPTKVTMNSTYFAAIIVGYVAHVGGVNIAVTASPSDITAINLMTGSAFSSTHLVIDHNGFDLVLSSDDSSGGYLTVISCNPA